MANAGYTASPVGTSSLVGLLHYAHFHEHYYTVVGLPWAWLEGHGLGPLTLPMRSLILYQPPQHCVQHNSCLSFPTSWKLSLRTFKI